MADLPPSATARLRLVYRNVTGIHRCTLRIGTGLDAKEAGRATLVNIMQILDEYLPSSFEIVGLEYIARGLEIAQPEPTPDVTLTLSATDIQGTQYAGQWRWEGRALGLIDNTLVASKVNFSIHGLVLTPPPGFRYKASDNSILASVTARLNLLTGNNNLVALAINGAKATWYDYTNYNYNSHFERKFRG